MSLETTNSTPQSPSMSALDAMPDGEIDLDRDDQATDVRIDLTRLYKLWEANNWSVFALDFRQDARDWRERLTPKQRQAARWNYALFLHGEEAVARTLAPFVVAVPTQEQRIFLTTQIVDEARHHVFFDRFMREVVADEDTVIAPGYESTLDLMRPELTIGFARVFGELDRLTEQLRRRPHDRALLAQCFTLYHLIIEGTLAHPGQHFIRTYLTERQIMPGFTQGMAHVARDESRHMAFGIQMVRELTANAPSARRAVIALINRILPWTVSLFIPPDFDEDYVRVFGKELEDIYAFALRSFESKLTRAGIAPSEIASLVNNGEEQAPIEQARRILRLVKAGVLGEAAPLHVDDATLALIFDGVARLANMSPAVELNSAIQWEFPDAPPWYLAPQGGKIVASQGWAGAPALTLRLRVDDWARIVGRKLDARWALVTRRLTTTGDLRLALRLPSILHM